MQKQENLIMNDELKLDRLTEFFRTLGDNSRMKILFVISKSEISVSGLAKQLSMTESAVSHHLRVLRMNRLVKWRREGKTILYELDDEHVKTVILQGCEHIGE